MITWALVYLFIKLRPTEIPIAVFIISGIMDVIIVGLLVDGIFGG